MSRSWLEDLKKFFKTGQELCHGGCGEVATKLVLRGKRTGAFCRGCWREIAEGYIPKLDPPKGIKRAPSRKAMME